MPPANPVLNQNPPSRPWQVLTIEDRGKGQYYRWFVTGLNHNYVPPDPFEWRVHDFDNRHYDLDAVADKIPANALP